MLGKRNRELYGSLTMFDINQLLAETYPEVDFTFFQSNHEGALIDVLQGSDEYDLLVINPGGLTHHSVSLRDAFELVTCKKAVVHLSDIDSREYFRRFDILKPLADVYVKGLKEQSYVLAVKELIEKHLQ
jgi:3-dehydroquinate dehydratase-2